MEKNKLVKIITKNYFLISNKTNDWIERLIRRDVEKAETLFYKRYKVDPREQDIKDMKKDIVMKKGVFFIVIIILLSLAFLR